MEEERGTMYQLFATDSGNVIGTFETEQEALEVLRSAVEAYGEDYADEVVLSILDAKTGAPKSIANGPYLAQMALAAGPKG
jgi:hypothetical protein